MSREISQINDYDGGFKEDLRKESWGPAAVQQSRCYYLTSDV